MYNLVKKSCSHYKDIMQGAGYRECINESLLLLTDTKKFYQAKAENSMDYRNLCDIISEMKELYISGEDKYHPFGNFLREVQNAGFDIDSMKPEGTTDKTKLHDQIELMRMFMCFRYCPDE